MIVYFTGTGNSAFVAQGLAKALEDEVFCANASVKAGKTEVFHSEKPYIFVFPVYLATIASVFLKFLEGSQFEGCGKAYFVATCAADVGSSGNDGAALCSKKGLTYMGLETVVMPQNYIALFPMTEDAEISRRLDQARQQVRQLAQVISSQAPLAPGLTDGGKYRFIKWVEKLYNGAFATTKGFRVTENCVCCGLCAKNCVMNRIHMENGKPRWQGNCVHCMSCINRCPKGAIEFGRLSRGKKRYVCPGFPKE